MNIFIWYYFSTIWVIIFKILVLIPFLPYLAHIFKDRLDDVTFIPIMVGSLNENKEKQYAKLLNKYISQEGTIVVVSSDFWLVNKFIHLKQLFTVILI